MSETVSRMKLYEDLSRAASLDMNVYPHLIQMLGYRKRVAEELLKNMDTERTEDLQDLYNYTNDQIKLILGL